MGAIADMIRAGVDPDLVERVAMEMLEATRLGLPVRSSAAIRQQRYRDRLKAGEGVTNVTRDVTRDAEPPSPPPPKNTNQTPSTPTPKQPRRAKARTGIAEDAQPTERQRAFARKLGLSADVFREEWRKFRTHHIANGSLMASWDAAWEKWCGNIGKYGARSPPKNTRPTIADRYANLINDEPDHDEPTHDGPTIDGSYSASGDDPRGRYAPAQPLEPLGTDPGWPLAATGYAGNHN